MPLSSMLARPSVNMPRQPQCKWVLACAKLANKYHTSLQPLMDLYSKAQTIAGFTLLVAMELYLATAWR